MRDHIKRQHPEEDPNSARKCVDAIKGKSGSNLGVVFFLVNVSNQ